MLLATAFSYISVSADITTVYISVVTGITETNKFLDIINDFNLNLCNPKIYIHISGHTLDLITSPSNLVTNLEVHQNYKFYDHLPLTEKLHIPTTNRKYKDITYRDYRNTNYKEIYNEIRKILYAEDPFKLNVDQLKKTYNNTLKHISTFFPLKTANLSIIIILFYIALYWDESHSKRSPTNR